MMLHLINGPRFLSVTPAKRLQQDAPRCVRTARAPVLVTNAQRNPSHEAQDTIKTARTQQIQATDMLAKLLQAADVQAVASEHVESLTEQFFMMSCTYLEMAKKEGNADVVGKLELVLGFAMAEKQKTLRPEIQLLNSLLSCKTPEERKKLLTAPDAKETLTTNERYFFTNLLDRMIEDVSRQKDQGGKQQALAEQLDQIKAEALWHLSS